MKLYNKFVGIPNRIKFISKISFLLFILMYFFFHAITGENGFRSYLVIKKKVDEQTKILDNLKKERDSLERRVKLLSNDSLDRDILEERCRIVLNLAMPDDIIIKENTIQ